MENALQEQAVASQPKTITPTMLKLGEIYVGAIISADGSRSHHIILLPGDNDDASHADQTAWAESIGGELPDRVESALLFATLKGEFKPDWYWTRELYWSDSAWFQTFSNGTQSFSFRSFKLRARAVRRLPI